MCLLLGVDMPACAPEGPWVPEDFATPPISYLDTRAGRQGKDRLSGHLQGSKGESTAFSEVLS